MPEQSKSNVVNIQGSHLKRAGAIFDTSTGNDKEIKAASDFWLALILVLAAAAFLDVAAVMF